MPRGHSGRWGQVRRTSGHRPVIDLHSVTGPLIVPVVRNHVQRLPAVTGNRWLIQGNDVVLPGLNQECVAFDSASMRETHAPSPGTLVELKRARHTQSAPSPGSTASSNWAWDGSVLSCRTSSNGYRPLYYSYDSGQMVATGSLMQCRRLVSDRSVDWTNVVLFLALGQFVEDLTLFSSIRALPAASSLRWKDGEAPSIAEQRVPPVCTDGVGSVTAMSHYDKLVLSALEQCSPLGDCALGLSGGRDSRHILLGLLQSGRRPSRVLTSHHYLGEASAIDVEVACSVADALNLPIETVLPPKNCVAAELVKNQVIEFQSLSHSWGLGLADAVEGEATLLDGMNGGVLFGRSGLVRHVRSQIGECLADWETLEKLAVEWLFDVPVAALVGFVSPSILSSEKIDLARAQLVASLRKYADYPNPLQAFLYFNHTARDTSCFTYGMMKAGNVICPLNDPELVNWALGLPWRISSLPTFQSDAILRHYPETGHIPFEEQYQPSTSAFQRDLKAEKSTIKKLLRNGGRSVVTRKGAKALLSGRASLKQIQVFAYLSQLTALIDAE